MGKFPVDAPKVARDTVRILSCARAEMPRRVTAVLGVLFRIGRQDTIPGNLKRRKMPLDFWAATGYNDTKEKKEKLVR